jgi:long-chain fatty acid transport protein
MRLRRVVLLGLAAGLVFVQIAAAGGYGLFQHGGRGMGQVGALTARADDPSALTYNPAAITHLDGFQAEAGVDFNNAEDSYRSDSGHFEAQHVIQYAPDVYLTWKSKSSPFAFGLGLDSPFWYVVNWEPVAFPGRFDSRRFALRVLELHPVVAYDLGDGWSIGGGIRYVFGDIAQEDNVVAQFFVPGSAAIPVEVEREAKADVDDLTYDLAIHYTSPAWGWGVVYRGATSLKGSGDLNYTARDAPQGIPGLDALIAARLRTGSASQAFELPRELRGGLWVAPYPELRLELDASWQSWSSLRDTAITYHSALPSDSFTELTPRDWDDTLSLRLGLEGDITDDFMLFGGVAYEPSPVPNNRVVPDFPRADDWVYAAGFSYQFPQISFDLGYSFHQYDSHDVSGQEQLNPNRPGRYSDREQVWGFGVRWRF